MAWTSSCAVVKLREDREAADLKGFQSIMAIVSKQKGHEHCLI
jgi:hypothetical protein